LKFSHFPLKLLIVGKSNLEGKLKYLVSELGMETDTFYTGYISPEEVSEYHNIIDVFVSVSIEDSESFGVVVWEASASGKPVIVSNVGRLPEVVDAGVNGFVVEKKNPEELVEALDKLILNPDLRIKMGRNGREKVTRENVWEDSVKRIVNIYKSILNSHGI
jgi:glycosyltransferase involved in cell wall biosynthesis